MKKRFDIADYIVTIILVAFFAFMIGASVGAQGTKNMVSPMLNGEAELVDCTEAGCSFLVKRKDQSKDWVWVPAPKEK